MSGSISALMSSRWSWSRCSSSTRVAALDGVSAPARMDGDAASTRDALATGSRIPRAYEP
jgi:hypothetical protein